MLKPDRKLTFAETRGAGDVLAAAVVAAAEGRAAAEGSTPDASGSGSLEEAAAAGMDAAAEFLKDVIDERPY